MSELTDDGLAGAVQRITELAERSVTADQRLLIERTSELNALLVFTPDSSVPHRIDLPRHFLSKIASVDQVAGAIKRFVGMYDPTPIVYYSEKAVRIVLDTDYTNDRSVTCALSMTTSWQLLLGLKSRTFEQESLLRFLRFDIGEDNLDESGRRLVSWLRTVEIRNGETSTRTIGTARESLGKAVDTEVKSLAGEMPEQITISARVFTDRALRERQHVPCVVDFSPLRKEFRIVPEPNAIEDAIDHELAALEVFLVDAIASLELDFEIACLFGDA
jgi:hypothetical protein